MPSNGGCCTISGYPGGDKKKLDTAEIIQKQHREQAVNDHVFLWNKMQKNIFQNLMIAQGITNVLMGGKAADNSVTYKTCMGPGSSGSPVFNDQGVFGMHSGGFWYPTNKPTDINIVLGFAYALYIIIRRLVILLKENRNFELLKKFEEAVKGNSYLEEILRAEPTNDSEKPVEID